MTRPCTICVASIGAKPDRFQNASHFSRFVAFVAVADVFMALLRIVS